MSRGLLFAVFITCQLFQHCYAKNPDEINVFVSILPQKYFIERIGGGHVNVSVMVGTGQNPATYEPSPKQMAQLNKSQLYFQIGVPFENIWIDVIKELNSNLEIVECCKDLRSILIEGHSHDHHAHENNATDPHVWTSPANAKKIAFKIKQALIDINPGYKAEFEQNYSVFAGELNKLDQEIRQRLSGLDNRYIIVSHPSWGYYAQEYGLTQLSIESDGKEVRAKSLTRLIDFALSNKIKTVFVQKQFNRNSAEILAREIGAKVVELDPLAEDFITNLYYVTDAILNRVNSNGTYH